MSSPVAADLIEALATLDEAGFTPRVTYKTPSPRMNIGQRIAGMSFRKRNARFQGGASFGKAWRRAYTTKKRRLFSQPYRRRRYLAGNPNPRTAGFLGVEHKFLDMTYAPTNIANTLACATGEADPTSGSANCLSCPAVGDSEQQRDGRKIVIESIHIKGNIYRTAEAATAIADPGRCVLFLVLDTQTNGAAINSEDVFKSIGGTLDQSVDCHRNLLFGNRFRVLKKLVWTPSMNSVAYSGTVGTVWMNGQTRTFEFHVKFPKGLHINMTAGTTADVANVIDNSLHMINFASIANKFNLEYGARIRFQG